MDRRTYLRLLPAASLVGVAGCSSDDGTGGGGDDTAESATDAETETTDAGTGTQSDDEPETTDAETETTEAEPAVDPEASIADAAAALDDALDGIDSESDSFGDISGGARFEDAPIRSSVESARGHLDTAEEADLSAEQQAAVDGLRNLADYVSALTDAMVPIASGFDSLGTAQSYIDTERYGDGIDALDEARDAFRTASTRLETARTAFDGVDEVAFDYVDATQSESEAGLDTVDTVVETMDPFISGYRGFIRGYQEFEAGTTALEAEEFSDAASQYDAASVRFDDAESAFMDAEDVAPPEMRSDVIDLTCFSGALRDASKHYANAARALEEGDRSTANEEVEAAEEDANRCESGSSASLATPAL
ncbi:hypothetical protein [Halostella litorea]|uniref:hypothetical protein n=1 Tax=Halostella litorea TaxID=2528831 RepID=UPI00109227AD|nr:hypothetical protein [Halostella litorea]